MAVDAATDVKRSEGIHVAKCPPRRRPAATIRSNSRRVSLLSSCRDRASTTEAVAADPNRQRHRAMARAGAAHAAIIGPDEERNTNATASQTMSAAGGR